MSYEEISEVTGATIPALKNKVLRAKEKIRRILAPVISDFESL
jgi:DNA-directed RNA polymerase specialized sigma24 family protein